MKSLLSALMIASTLCIILNGCKGKDAVSNDPRAVLVAFFDRMAKKDIDGAAKLATKDSKATMDMMRKGMEMAEKMKDNPMVKDQAKMKEEDPTEAFKNIEIGTPTINGNDATVPFKNTKENRSFDFPLKKEDGGWKVDFSMATLMKMGMQEGGRHGYDPNEIDSTNPNFNIDSLRKGMNMMDSLMKTIDTTKLNKLKDAMKELEKLKH